MKIQGMQQTQRQMANMVKGSLILGFAALGVMTWQLPTQADTKMLNGETSNAVKEESDEITGKVGTCPWSLRSGVLRIGAGKLVEGGNWYKYADQIREIQITGRVVLPEDALRLFSSLAHLQRFTGAQNIDTSQVVDMSFMFQYDSELKALDLRGWDVRQVESMTEMFERDGALQELHVADWQTHALVWVDGLFLGSGLSTLDVSKWDVRHVEHMEFMFNGMSNLTDLDLGQWQTTNVQDMSGMFAEDHQLTELHGLAQWDTSQVTSLDGMFMGTSIESLDLHRWDVRQVRNMDKVFWRCNQLTRLNVRGWQTGRVTNMAMMFQWVPARELAIGDWDVSQVTDMNQMLAQTGATTLDLHKWDVRNVVNFEQMLTNSTATTVNVSGWQTSHAGSMQKLFMGAAATSLDLSGFDMRHLDYRDNPMGPYWDEGRVELMLANMPNLKVLKFGKQNYLRDQNGFTVGLSNFKSEYDDTIRINWHDTDQWQAIGSGTAANPAGPSLPVKQLETQFTSEMAGTYVRVPRSGAIRVEYREAETETYLGGKSLTGKYGAAFVVTPPVIAGYQYQSSSRPPAGTFDTAGQLITLYYQKRPAEGVVNVTYLDADNDKHMLGTRSFSGKINTPFTLDQLITPAETSFLTGYVYRHGNITGTGGLYRTAPQAVRLYFQKVTPNPTPTPTPTPVISTPQPEPQPGGQAATMTPEPQPSLPVQTGNRQEPSQGDADDKPVASAAKRPVKSAQQQASPRKSVVTHGQIGVTKKETILPATSESRQNLLEFVGSGLIILLGLHWWRHQE